MVLNALVKPFINSHRSLKYLNNLTLLTTRINLNTLRILKLFCHESSSGNNAYVITSTHDTKMMNKSNPNQM